MIDDVVVDGWKRVFLDDGYHVLMRISTFLLTFLLAGCDSATAPPPVSDTTSFEAELSPWTAVAIDTGSNGAAHASWSVNRTNVSSTDGNWSAQLRAYNGTDAVKVWLERRFELPTSATDTWDVSISYDFGTSDEGAFNLWRIVAGAFAEAPRSADALAPAFRGETGGATSNGTLRWLNRTYTARVQTSERHLYVVVGVWGTYETERAYLIDNLRVSITPRRRTSAE